MRWVCFWRPRPAVAAAVSGVRRVNRVRRRVTTAIMGVGAFAAPVSLACVLVLNREPQAQTTPRAPVPYEQAIEGRRHDDIITPRTTANVPEPAAIALLGAACIFLWSIRRGR